MNAPASDVQHLASALPLIVITGPTASGKSSLAMELAEEYGGEIICADSRTIYKSMDIGTAKPSLADQKLVPHHLLDMVNPGEMFTAADFKRATNQAIADIRARNRVPFLVGGTGLYIDGVVLDLDFQKSDKHERERLDKLSITELQKLFSLQQKPLPENAENKRHLINNLMRNQQQSSVKSSIIPDTYVVAIATQRADLEIRIRDRARALFASGVVDEAAQLASTYGWDSEAMTGNIYPIVRRYSDGELTLEQAIELTVVRDRQLAKRQVTWLKRHDYVKWCSLDEARDYLSTILDRS